MTKRSARDKGRGGSDAQHDFAELLAALEAGVGFGALIEGKNFVDM